MAEERNEAELRGDAAPPRVIPLCGADPGPTGDGGATAPLDREQQLARDVADIARARDALLQAESAPPAPASTIVFFSNPLRRTADAVPVILGSALGGLMLLVFTVVAFFVKVAR